MRPTAGRNRKILSGASQPVPFNKVEQFVVHLRFPALLRFLERGLRLFRIPVDTLKDR